MILTAGFNTTTKQKQKYLFAGYMSRDVKYRKREGGTDGNGESGQGRCFISNRIEDASL